MKEKVLSILFVISCLISYSYAQSRQLTGKVTSAADGSAISGASIAIVGTSAATQTDESGNYALSVSGTEVELSISYIGFVAQRIKVGNRTSLDVALVSDDETLEEVVVTALGISRDKKSLGYATQEVKGDVLTAARGGNALQSLSGNVAGAVISAPSSSLGGSTRIVLRGIGSLTGENRPLLVVDGIPMDNSNYNSNNAQRGAGGRDYGDAGFDINPDDIESVNVLKGGPASALYGARAANGVVLIKTKSAKRGRDEIVLNTGVAFENLGITPKLQKLYGGGFDSEFATATINGQEFPVADYSADESWGPRLDGQQVLHWDAFDPNDTENYLKTRPWSYPTNDYRTFFNTGVSYTNALSLAKSYENTAARLSLSNVSQSGIVPNTELKRSTVALSLDNKFSDKLTARGTINYVRTNGFNRPEQGYGDNSIGQKMFQWGQTQLDYSRLKNYKTASGEQKSWNRSSWDDATPKYSDNYYWIVNENTATDQRDRFYGNVELRYDIMPGLYATGNIYGDNYTLKINSQVAVGSQAVSSFTESLREFTEMNYEGRIHFDKKWNVFSLNAFAGTNRRNTTRYSSNAATAGGLIVPNLYTINNSAEAATINTDLSRKRVNSVFGNFSAGYKDLLFVDFGWRNDWSSTLPKDNNSYFYPSVTGSFVFSQLYKPSWLNFGKLRAGWSQVGNDTDPYRLLDVYLNNVYNNTSYLDNPYFLLGLSKLNANLRPETKKSYEFGLEAQFLDNRLGIDFTYYNEETTDLIMSVSTGAETGYSSKVMNAGRAVNKGVEAMLTVVPVRSGAFEWSSNINFSRNRNKVVELFGDLQTLTIATAPFKASLIASVDQPFGQIYGSDFIYDDDGNKVVGANGLYLASDVQNLGSILPDFNAGWRNTFNYKNLSLSALIDMQKGGKFFSTSNMFGSYTGVLEETAANGVRESGMVSEGVTGTVTRNADGTYTVTNTAPNEENVSAQQYYGHYYGGPTAQNVFNADYIKLREITLGYTLSSEFVNKLRLKSATISGFARNIATWGLDNRNFDPEMATTGSGNIQGFEGGNLPASRTFGVNLRLQF
ncbi:SusC/RagA family TonB-linked outer membrane protein [Sphingobacterium griseoflavum]|uniref:SusC/RagA family TonB-linked outer membrane protein n=1 Tax=Sphingobacterium griseoflavum TaxID=1474952 RepID=A0ABQ3HVP1_9SPHI|nr:SusC/RagA family TonB-linked outer membrane protein [Sphingobacterium griseoflavum]GHE32104.1 SusC/RagA family TonB-linked outer membrane protein [Sphingobacterium griseoflavum]